MNSDTKKYLLSFFITSAIFATALLLGNYFGEKKLEELKAVENQISIDILSSETQFALLGELTCPGGQSPTLSDELNSLGEKLKYNEEKFGTDNVSFIQLKKQYSLLEIKDYLLIKKLKNCKTRPTAILYFYSKECEDCDKMGYVLTYLRNKNPTLRVYSFDYELDLPALKTLATIYGIEKGKMPALIMNDELHVGYKTIEEIEKLVPELKMTESLEKEI